MQNEISDDLRNKLAQFQTMQQQLQLVAVQRQQLFVEKSEAEEAQKELAAGKGDVYKAVGPILIKSDRLTLKKELDEAVSAAEHRLTLLDNQEKKLTLKGQELQKELQSGLKGMGLAGA